jgi:hypothetical protein
MLLYIHAHVKVLRPQKEAFGVLELAATVVGPLEPFKPPLPCLRKPDKSRGWSGSVVHGDS